MIILGNNYEFTEYELNRLEKKVETLTQLIRNDHSDAEIITSLDETIREKNATAIVLNLVKPATKELIHFLTELEFKGIKFYTLESFMETFLHKCYIPYDAGDLSYLQSVRRYKKIEFLQKRLLDYIGATLLLILLWPVMLWASFRIKRSSPGPIFFTQKRVGINDIEFTCVKFRSMNVDAEKDGAKWAEENDPRIYPFGEFMRKTRIDELPQLFNVLRGDMHLVGPRPERKVFTNELCKELPYYDERHVIRPGITGWAQVNYPYGASVEDARQKLMYDLYYAKNWSIWLEMKTAFKTVYVVISKQGT
jgi:exopolysaccharide biosynthesis polyprenyl glycosylphosphotransferase